MNQLLGQLFYLILRFLDFTYRYQYSNEEVRDKAIANGGYIFALWHQNILGCLLGQKLERHVMIVSPSKDGELAAIVSEKLGHHTARGSSSRDGQKAAILMAKEVKSGRPGAITVDGPRGPAHKVKKGIVEIAKSTGAVVLPYATYPERYWCVEKSWDKFRIPKPFTRIIVKYGEPIHVPHDISQEEVLRLCEQVKQAIENTQELAKKVLDDPQQLAQCKTSQGDRKRRNT